MEAIGEAVLLSDMNDLIADLVDGAIDPNQIIEVQSVGRRMSVLAYVAGHATATDTPTRIHNLIELGKGEVTEEVLWHALDNIGLIKNFPTLEALMEHKAAETPLPPDAICLVVKKAIFGTPVDSTKSVELILSYQGNPNTNFISAGDGNMGFMENHLMTSDTPLSIAIRDLPIHGKGTMQLDIIKMLLEAKADPNQFHPPGRESLFHLALSRPLSTVIIERLIETNCEARISLSKQTPLHVALGNRKVNTQQCRLLIQYQKELINVQDEHGNTPLLAFFYNRTIWPKSLTPPMISQILQDLVDCGSDLRCTNERGHNVAHLIAGMSGQGEMTRAAMQIILQKEPSLLQKKSKVGETILHMFNLNSAIVHISLRHGVNINGKAKYQSSPCMLLTYGKAQDRNGKTALHNAVQRNRLELVKILLECGAKTKIKDSAGHDALFYQTELLTGASTMKTAKEIRSRVQKGLESSCSQPRSISHGVAGKRKSEDNEDPPNKYARTIFRAVVLDTPVENQTTILSLPLEILFEIFSLLEPRSLCQCERVCKGWNDMLRGPDEVRLWKRFCNQYFWCPKGGWESYLQRSPRKRKVYSAKGFYVQQRENTCKGCNRPTSAYYELFNEKVCLTCRRSHDKYYYYTDNEVSLLQLTKGELKNVQGGKVKTRFYKLSVYIAKDIEEIVFRKYGTKDGAQRLLDIEKRRSFSRTCNFRVRRLYGHLSSGGESRRVLLPTQSNNSPTNL